MSNPVWTEPAAEPASESKPPDVSPPTISGEQLMAVTAEIRRLADLTGAGHMLSDAACQQWAECILIAIDAVGAAPAAEHEPLTA